MMKKALFLILSASLILAAAGCGVSGTATQASTVEKGLYSVGQTAKMGNLELSVLKAEKSPGTKADAPDSPGDIFLIVSISI